MRKSLYAPKISNPNHCSYCFIVLLTCGGYYSSLCLQACSMAMAPACWKTCGQQGQWVVDLQSNNHLI